MILLDTNALIHALTQPRRLSERVRRLLESSSEVHVSSLSFLEIAIKERVSERTPSDYIGLAERSNYHHLPFSAQDASHIRNFSALGGHDPFDRAILAQASRNNATLLTSDKRLLDLGLSWVQDSQD